VVHSLEIAMPPCAAVRMNEKSPPATPGRPTPSPEKVAQRVKLGHFIKTVGAEGRSGT
jgi:hypothetical protein